MSDGLITIDNVWHAALAAYSGYELASVEAVDNRRSRFQFFAPECDWNLILTDYNAGQLQLSDARAFVKAFNDVTQKQKEVRLSGMLRWDSPKLMGLS